MNLDPRLEQSGNTLPELPRFPEGHLENLEKYYALIKLRSETGCFWSDCPIHGPAFGFAHNKRTMPPESPCAQYPTHPPKTSQKG